MHGKRIATASLFSTLAFLVGCQEPGYRNMVYPNSQGGGYTIQRVPKDPGEMAPRTAAADSRPKVRTATESADATAGVVLLEGTFWEAIKAGDSQKLEPLLANDFVQTGLTGNVSTRAQFLDDVRNRSLMVNSVNTSMSPINLHDNTAIVTGKLSLSAKLRGTDIGGDYVFTDTLMQTPIGWQKIASQVSRAQP
jgi:hypothetical protein